MRDKPRGNTFPPEYFRPETAAAHFGISKRMLENWVRQGLLSPPYKPTPGISLYNRERLTAEMHRLLGHSSAKEIINPCDELLNQ